MKDFRMSSPARIDTHQHLIPPKYRALLDTRGLTAGGWPTPAWDAQAAIALMDKESIATGVLSLSAPGVHLADDAEGRSLARETNEFGAELVRGLHGGLLHQQGRHRPDGQGPGRRAGTGRHPGQRHRAGRDRHRPAAQQPWHR